MNYNDRVFIKNRQIEYGMKARFSLATMPEEDDYDVVCGIPLCFTKSVMNGIIKRNNWGYHKKSD